MGESCPGRCYKQSHREIWQDLCQFVLVKHGSAPSTERASLPGAVKVRRNKSETEQYTSVPHLIAPPGPRSEVSTTVAMRVPLVLAHCVSCSLGELETSNLKS